MSRRIGRFISAAPAIPCWSLAISAARCVDVTITVDGGAGNDHSRQRHELGLQGRHGLPAAMAATPPRRRPGLNRGVCRLFRFSIHDTLMPSFVTSSTRWTDLVRAGPRRHKRHDPHADQRAAVLCRIRTDPAGANGETVFDSTNRCVFDSRHI